MAIRWCRYRYQWPVSSGPESEWQEVLATGLGSGSELSVFLKSGLCLRAQSVEGRVRPVSVCVLQGRLLCKKIKMLCWVKCWVLLPIVVILDPHHYIEINLAITAEIFLWLIERHSHPWLSGRQDWARPVSGPLVPDLRSPVCGSETGSQWQCDEAR